MNCLKGKIIMPCANCQTQTCFTGSGEMPAECPEKHRGKSKLHDSENEFIEYAKQIRDKNTNRLDELIEYANFMGYKKIGLAGCIGLHDELRVISGLLQKAGFSVSSVMCKTGSLKKKFVGVPAKNRMTTQTGYNIGVIACNPVAQALILNKEKTDLNGIIGLCAGHDSVFMKHSLAPVVTLIAKDRSNGHNPASILYNFYGDNLFSRRPNPKGAFQYNARHIRPIDIIRMIKRKI